MKKRNLIIASVLAGSLFSVAAVGAANACNSKGGHRDGHGGKMMHMMKKLDLTEKQSETIRSIKKEQKEKMQSTRAKMKEIRKSLQEQSKAENFDAAKVRELADTKAKLMADMTVMRTETMHRIRKELTPEQVDKFDSMKQHKSKHGDRK